LWTALKSLEICPKSRFYIIGGGEIYNLGIPYADKIDYQSTPDFEG
jgi:dihydrofolate reductase